MSLGSDSGGFESIEHSSSTGIQSPSPAVPAVGLVPSGDTGSLAGGSLASGGSVGTNASPGIVVDFIDSSPKASRPFIGHSIGKSIHCGSYGK